MGMLSRPIIDVQSVCLLRDLMYNYYSLRTCITTTLSFWRLNISVHNQIILKSILHTDYNLQWWQQVHISTAAIGMQLHTIKLQIIFREHKHHYSLILPPTSWRPKNLTETHILGSHFNNLFDNWFNCCWCIKDAVRYNYCLRWLQQYCPKSKIIWCFVFAHRASESGT